jgi:aminoglycoside 6'-N-acetyltransferase I
MIRRLTESDREDWLRMRHALWTDCPADVHQHEMTQLLREQDAAVFVSVDGDGHLDGFVELSIRTFAEGCHSGRVGYVEGWYVAPDRRGCGVGKALLAAAEAWAIAAGCREMASDTEIQNTASQVAHARCGYADVGRVVHFRKDLPPEPNARRE